MVPDVDERLPGRGLWVTADRERIAEAVTKRLFARAARRAVVVDLDLVDQVRDQLARRCVEGLALARRAGLAVVGQTKVRAALQTGVPGVLVEAVDGAPEGRARIRALAGDRGVVSVLTAAELAGVFGREHAVHAFVRADGRGPGLTDRLSRDGARLAGLRRNGAAPRLEKPAGTCMQGEAR